VLSKNLFRKTSLEKKAGILTRPKDAKQKISKHEIPNSKQTQMIKIHKILNELHSGAKFWIVLFELVTLFRISIFGFVPWLYFDYDCWRQNTV
jgi:hypothetical protein